MRVFPKCIKELKEIGLILWKAIRIGARSVTECHRIYKKMQVDQENINTRVPKETSNLQQIKLHYYKIILHL